MLWKPLPSQHHHEHLMIEQRKKLSNIKGDNAHLEALRPPRLDKVSEE
jgi:hypothetical protein